MRFVLWICIGMLLPYSLCAALSDEEEKTILSHPPENFTSCNTDKECKTIYVVCMDKFQSINTAKAEEFSRIINHSVRAMKCVPQHTPDPASACVKNECTLR